MNAASAAGNQKAETEAKKIGMVTAISIVAIIALAIVLLAGMATAVILIKRLQIKKENDSIQIDISMDKEETPHE